MAHPGGADLNLESCRTQDALVRNSGGSAVPGTRGIRRRRQAQLRWLARNGTVTKVNRSFPEAVRMLPTLLIGVAAGILPLSAVGQDTQGPSVEEVRVVSSPQLEDTWIAHEEIRIRVRFSDPVLVTGVPRLALEIGDRTTFADYYYSNDRWVWFRYTVRSEDRDPDGISIGSGALLLNGGTIADASGNAANLSLGRHAITNDRDHKVDGTAADTVPPSVTRIMDLQPAAGRGHLAGRRGNADPGPLQRAGGGDRNPAAGPDARRADRVRQL